MGLKFVSGIYARFASNSMIPPYVILYFEKLALREAGLL